MMMWLLFRLGDAEAVVLRGRLDGYLTTTPVFAGAISCVDAITGIIEANE